MVHWSELVDENIITVIDWEHSDLDGGQRKPNLFSLMERKFDPYLIPVDDPSIFPFLSIMGLGGQEMNGISDIKY